MDHNQQGQGQHGQGRRGHFNRGRRGNDRRGQERRPPSSPQAEEQPQGAPRGGSRGGDVDVEQIMRDIRARIAQRHGIDLSVQQVRELAARRLEAILDPRNLNPELLAQLRKSAGAPVVDDPAAQAPLPTYAFEDDTLYETHRGLLRAMRRLLNPLLKLFFNPNPIVHALNTQARVNSELDRRTAGHDRQQAEWNALQFELLQRMVTENARLSVEVQSLTMKVESLAARVDFADRRVRALEAMPAQRNQGGGHRQSQAPQHVASPAPAPVAQAPAAPAHNSPHSSQHDGPRDGAGQAQAAPAAADGALVTPAFGSVDGGTGQGQGDAPRKRRRRRRGRRGDRPMSGEGGSDLQQGADAADAADGADGGDEGNAEGDDAPESREAAPASPAFPVAEVSQPASQAQPAPQPAPEPVSEPASTAAPAAPAGHEPASSTGEPEREA